MLVKIYGIYNEVHCLRYVGKTGILLESRLKNHIKEALAGTMNHRCNGIRAMLRRGFSPTIDLFTEIEEYKWREVERVYIKHFNDLGYNLWNGTEGGDGVPFQFMRRGFHQTKEHRQKIRDALRGRVPSEKTRQALILATKGKHHSVEHNRKISLAGMGRVMSVETRRKLSIANTGYRHTPEAKMKLSLACKGRKLTEEHKKKIGIAGKRRKLSLKTRLKMSAAAKRRNQFITNRNELGQIINWETRTHPGRVRSDRLK